MSDSIIDSRPLGFLWETSDPFLFCVHHEDHYPAGNEHLGPAASLEGRNIGQDFTLRDGWRMYHGDVVPGFPRHPHRGFETVTLARRGYIDHADSLGARARFGQGDVQWMTAGTGVVHSEMFPLLHRDRPNPTELFQIWLNLPAEDKHVPAHFTMLWSESIPRGVFTDDRGGSTEVVVIAGELGGLRGPRTPPSSWAARPENEVGIWTIKLSPGARWTLPAASAGVKRGLYFFRGESASIDGRELPAGTGLRLRGDAAVALVNGPEESELLLLQGRPIAQPVVQHGPFVMNTPAEIRQAFLDYHRTGFGGWPWPVPGPVHGRERGRFAVHADGAVEEPGS